MREVEDIGFSKDLDELIKNYERSGGFTAKSVAEASQILQNMISDKECKRFISFPANIIATGVRGLIAKAIENGWFDIIVTTSGTLDHDLAKAWGGKYYHGDFFADDTKLRNQGINRLGNIFVPNDSYGVTIEKNMERILSQLHSKKKVWSGRELIHEIGKHVKDENSIVYQATKHNVPIYVPGYFDGAFGTNITFFATNHQDFQIDILQDEKELSEIAFKLKKSGALIIGGGISKHHTIWWNQFSGGLKYAVYVTTASEYDGSLSGARTHEAVSWGKIKPDSEHVNVIGDATVLLPLLLSSIKKI